MPAFHAKYSASGARRSPCPASGLLHQSRASRAIGRAKSSANSAAVASTGVDGSPPTSAGRDAARVGTAADGGAPARATGDAIGAVSGCASALTCVVTFGFSLPGRSHAGAEGLGRRRPVRAHIVSLAPAPEPATTSGDGAAFTRRSGRRVALLAARA